MTVSAMRRSSRARAAAVPASAPALPPPSPIFSRTCSAWPGSAAGGGRERGADLRYNMEITLEEAFLGKTAQIEIPVSVTCESCSGHRRQGRHQAEDLLDVRRGGPGAAGAGIFHAGANLSRLSGTRPDDRGRLSVMFRLGTGDARADLVGQYSARRRRRHADPAGRRRRGRRSRRSVRAISTFSCRWPRISSSSAMAPTCIAACRSRW